MDMHTPEKTHSSYPTMAPPYAPNDGNFQTMTVAENWVPGSVNGFPAPGGVAAGNAQEGWWQRTKRIYAQEWKIRDTVFPPQPAMLGIGMATAALTANLMGLGIATMPLAFAGIGWSAIFFILIFGALTAFNSLLLGWCCDILEERHEEFRKFYWYTQYTDIASKAFGPLGGSIVVALRLLSVVGLQAVLLVTVAEYGADFVGAFYPPLEIQGYMYCGFVTGLGILFAIFPVGSKTRYWSNIGYLPFHLVLLILLIAGLANSRTKPTLGAPSSAATSNSFLSLDLGRIINPFKYITVSIPKVAGGWTQSISGASFFAGLGILAFNYANIAGFPLLRRDVRAPADFNKAAVGSVAGNTLACLVVGAVGYSTFGAVVNGNIVVSLDSAGVRLAADIFLLFASASTMILINATLDEHDSCDDYGKRFLWSRHKRISPLMLLACLLGLAVPFKGPLMALVGSLVVCPIIYMLPPVFYFKLCKESDQWPEKPLSILIKAALAISLFVGLLVALGGSASAIVEIVYQSQATTQSCLRGFFYNEQFQLIPRPSIFPHILSPFVNNINIPVG
ncbi:uncharacterized protein LOC144141610 [Haemaphysalis longicornis]